MSSDAVGMPLTAVEVEESPSERLARLFEAHHERLFRLARRLTSSREEARDLVQEAFLRAIRAGDALPAVPSGQEAWLVRTLVNACRDQWRRRAVRTRLLSEYQGVVPLVEHPTVERSLIARSTIWRALQRLVPRRRAVIVLHELEGVDVPEIARLLGVSAITVRWHLSRGRQDLSRVVKHEA